MLTAKSESTETPDWGPTFLRGAKSMGNGLAIVFALQPAKFVLNSELW